MNEMRICISCETNIEIHNTVCPICNVNQHTKQQETINQTEQNIITLGWKKLMLILSFLMGFIPVMISIIIDLIQNDMVTWSKIVALSVGSAWLYILIILVLGKYPFILGLALLVITNVFLFLLNYFQQDDWFMKFGLFLALGIPFISYPCFRIIKKVQDNFFKVLAVFLFGASFICIFMDMLYYFYDMGQIKITWSLIVLGATLPLASLLLYLSNHKKIINGWMQY